MSHSSNKDNVFATPMTPTPFAFDTQVADVFDDMIQRSVPGYGFLLDVIGMLAQRFGRAGTHCYDLGCSLGTTTLRLRQHLPARCHVVGVDNALAMVTRCQQRLVGDNSQASYEITRANIQDIGIHNASIVLLNFTLQFIANEQRQAIMNQIYAGMNSGGVLLLAEKICFTNSQEQQLQTDLHHDFKRLQGYSDLEIAQKRAALENILVPNTLNQHQKRLIKAGFSQVAICMQCLNFCALLAFK